MIRSGATGRGATAGKASLGLVYTVLNPTPPAQFETVELQAWTWKLRSALNRPPLSFGPFIALTCKRPIWCAAASLTVTDWPLPTVVACTSSHVVLSVSSVRPVGSEPSLDVALAPLPADAQL